MKIRAFINWKNYDKDGNLISEYEHEANSFVKQFAQFLINRLFDSVAIGFRDITNTVHNYSAGSGYVDGAVGNDSLGIIVGTGTNAVTISDYVLQTRITDGATAGKLLYGTCTVDSDVTIDGSTAYFQIYRTFTNSSGAPITIQEIGIYHFITGGTYYYLLERSLSENTIANAASATLTYKITITV